MLGLMPQERPGTVAAWCIPSRRQFSGQYGTGNDGRVCRTALAAMRNISEDIRLLWYSSNQMSSIPLVPFFLAYLHLHKPLVRPLLGSIKKKMGKKRSRWERQHFLGSTRSGFSLGRYERDRLPMPSEGSTSHSILTV
jgi:hypothetical protein